MTIHIYLLTYVGEEWQEEQTDILSAHTTLAGAQKAAEDKEQELWGEDADKGLKWSPNPDEDHLRASGLQSGPYFYCIDRMEVT